MWCVVACYIVLYYALSEDEKSDLCIEVIQKKGKKKDDTSLKEYSEKDFDS